MNDCVRINGIEKPLTAATVADLLRVEKVDPQARFVAVAVNGAIVPRAQWADAPVRPDDEVEIVRPAPGG